jgi:hypothetical protein
MRTREQRTVTHARKQGGKQQGQQNNSYGSGLKIRVELNTGIVAIHFQCGVPEEQQPATAPYLPYLPSYITRPQHPQLQVFPQ